MKVQIECNEKQIAIIQNALDVYSRVIMGQFKELADLFEEFSDYWMDSKKRNEVDDKIKEIRDIVHPELIGYAHFGIFNPQCPLPGRNAWDLIQSIRYPLAWYRNPKGGGGVDFGIPIPAGDQPLATVKVIKEDTDAT